METLLPAKTRSLFAGDSKGLSASTSTKTTADDLRHEITNTSVVPKPKSACLDDLSDDVFLEILLKVPAKSLHRFKCVSKRWLSLISAPCFARSYNVRQRPTNMMFLKIRHCRSNKKPPFLANGIYGFPTFHDDFDKLLPLTFDFIPTEKVLLDMELRSISDGLVLLRCIFRGITDASRNYYYYVCNPITKEWVELPLISTDDSIIDFAAYCPRQVDEGGRDTRIWGHTSSYDNFTKHVSSYDPNKIEFTAVSINREYRDAVFIIRVFSSCNLTTGWSVFRVPFPHDYSLMTGCLTTKVLFLNGKFHWLGDRCIAACDPFNKC